jgi:thiamine-monophosphate kinase
MKINYHDPQLINVCEEFDIDSTTVAINGGEDYELLFTIAMEDFDKIKGNPNSHHWSHDAGK